jgi:hypothetical protein
MTRTSAGRDQLDPRDHTLSDPDHGVLTTRTTVLPRRAANYGENRADALRSRASWQNHETI